MRAVEFKEYGGPEVLGLVEAEVPEPGSGQVSIDVAYVGVNFADLKAREVGYRVPSLPFRPGLTPSGSSPNVRSAPSPRQGWNSPSPPSSPWPRPPRPTSSWAAAPARASC